VKALLRIFRLPRKLVIIVGGVALLMGSSGVFALFIGKDKVLVMAGMATETSDGLECTDVNLVTIRKQNHLWIRKYITTAPTDGLTRIKTALRVAKAVYDTQKPDLVQVVVLDKSGPTLRSDIRGRALGADVIYVPDPSKVGEGTVDAPYTARYYDGGASDQGLFYGERIDMQPSDIDGMIASLKDHSDCQNQVAVETTKSGGAEAGKKKKAAPAEEKANTGAEKAAEPETPPTQHPAPASSNAKPEEGATGSFTGASADDPASKPHLEMEAADRPQIDPETTGSNVKRSPVTN
jgi:hypothetical protein